MKKITFSAIFSLFCSDTEKKIIFWRSIRWTFVAFLIGVSPLLLSMLILSLINIKELGFEELYTRYLSNGTLIVVGLTIHGGKYIDFSYSRDYDILNNHIYSIISIPFLLNAILGVALFIFLHTIFLHSNGTVVGNETLDTSFNSSLIFTWSWAIFIVAVIHTCIMHILGLNFQRRKGQLYLPTVDGEMNCNVCSTYYKNYLIEKRKKKISEHSIIKDEFPEERQKKK